MRKVVFLGMLHDKNSTFLEQVFFQNQLGNLVKCGQIVRGIRKNQVEFLSVGIQKTEHVHRVEPQVVHLQLIAHFPDKFGALSLLKFQEDIEHRAWVEGGRKQTAPAQRMYDFVNKKVSESLPSTSYTPGVVSSPLHEWLPNYVTSRLREAFIEVGKKQKGYLTNDALLHAVESRTSSPVRVVRNRETLEHEEIAGLYPCGEGAGYAGGIVSAAMDGENCAEALAEKLTGIKIRS